MKNIIFTFLLFFFHVLSSQNFDKNEFSTIKSNLFSDAVSVQNYLPKNPDLTGKTDYTKFVQLAIDQNKKLIFPDFPILISDIGLVLKSNQSLLFQEHSKLILKSSAKPAYKLINISSVENVKIYFLNLIGDKYTHLNKNGQWGNGLSIGASKDILIYKPNISKFWGDGIYIGNNSGIIPENITIDGGVIDDNRRNGISLISGKNIDIKNILISNTKGQNPQSGIDIEPNNGLNVIQNITLENIVTENNALHGIIISTGNLNGFNVAPISITINNHKDINSKIGLGIGVTRDKVYYNSLISGTIKVMNSTYNFSQLYDMKNYKGEKNNVKLIFQNVSAGNSTSKTTRNNQLETFLENFRNNTLYTIK